MTDILREFIGKEVIVYYRLLDGRSFRYQGIVLDITDVSIVLEDRKDGQMLLPLAQCQVTGVNSSS